MSEAAPLVRMSAVPLAWLVGAVAVLSAGALAPYGLGHAEGSSSSLETFYVVSHMHFGMSLTVLLLVFAGTYAAFDLRRFRYRRALAWLHVGLTWFGAALLLAPMIWLASGGTQQPISNPDSLFKTLSGISGGGYALTLVGAGVFVVLVVDALKRGTLVGGR